MNKYLFFLVFVRLFEIFFVPLHAILQWQSTEIDPIYILLMGNEP